MCGRVRTPGEWAEIRIELKLDDIFPDLNFRRSWNVSPTQDVVAVRRDAQTGKRRADLMRWGVIPRWEKEPATKLSTFNAKAEEIARAKLWKPLWSRGQRWLVVTDGFYEWVAGETAKAPKQPCAIARAGDGLTVFAGLWDSNSWSSETVTSCTIVTCAPDESFRWLHHRQPVILDEAQWPAWLGETPANDDQLLAMLKPLPTSAMKIWPVSRAVGNSRADGPGLVKPV